MSSSIPNLMGQSGGSLMSAISRPKTIGGLQAGTSFLAGLGSMQAYNDKASSYEIQSGEWATQAKDEFVSGTNQVAGLKNQYLSDIGAITNKAGAGGLDVGQGVAQTARQVVGANAVATMNVDTLASDIRARRDTINQIQADAAASEARQAGSMALLGGILGGGLKLLSAGVL